MGFGVKHSEVTEVIFEDNDQRRADLLQHNLEMPHLQLEAADRPPSEVPQDVAIYGTELDSFFDPCLEDNLDPEEDTEGGQGEGGNWD